MITQYAYYKIKETINLGISYVWQFELFKADCARFFCSHLHEGIYICFSGNIL